MLTLHDSGPLGRRDFLRVGTLSLGGLNLAGLLSAQSPEVPPSSRPVTDRSVIFVFLHGGPSQIETFDPKMSAPEGVRSAIGETKTSLPGVTFGSMFPRLASRADRLAVVRSFRTGDANHDIKPVVGRDTFAASVGAVYSHVAGANHPATGMPTNVMLFPRAVDSRAQPGVMSFGKFDAVGPFGAAATPFVPGSGGDMQRDMELRLPRERLADRRGLMRSFDALKSSFDVGAGAYDAARAKALEVILRGVGSAFDLSHESPRLAERYDTERLVRPEGYSKKWNNHKNYLDNARSLGKLLLLARRLVERGCGFVTVTTSFVWDMHADSNNATMTEGMGYMAPPLDHALSALLEDLEARGLSEKVLVVVCGEMGRTPRINKNGGRDHWGQLSPLLLAGGGLRMGAVVGQSNSTGGEPASTPITNRHLLGTIVDRAFDTGRLRVNRNVSREVLSMLEYPTIPGL